MKKTAKILLACIPCILVGQQSQINLKTDKSSLELYQMTGKLVLKSKKPSQFNKCSKALEPGFYLLVQENIEGNKEYQVVQLQD